MVSCWSFSFDQDRVYFRGFMKQKDVITSVDNFEVKSWRLMKVPIPAVQLKSKIKVSCCSVFDSRLCIWLFQ